MSDYQVWDFDDWGANHVISDTCQSHDCRDALLQLKKANPNFKVTLFAIPYEMTPELYSWASDNDNWIELVVHGFTHSSNYECEKMDYQEFDGWMEHSSMRRDLPSRWTKGFKAPGWQISDDIYKWLLYHGWWVADQGYNDERRPKELPAYVNYDGKFAVKTLGWNETAKAEIPHYKEVNAHHGHTWDCVGNGIYETLPQLLEKVKETKEFRFVSEAVG